MPGYSRAAIVTARRPGGMDLSADPSLDAWRGLVDLERLAAWMDARGLERGPIEEAARPPGGTQNILLKFRRGARWFMLRRPPLAAHMNGSETMRREARVLGALAETDVPHPRLIAGCPRSEERRVGKECVSTGRSRWSPYH